MLTRNEPMEAMRGILRDLQKKGFEKGFAIGFKTAQAEASEAMLAAKIEGAKAMQKACIIAFNPSSIIRLDPAAVVRESGDGATLSKGVGSEG